MSPRQDNPSESHSGMFGSYNSKRNQNKPSSTLTLAQLSRAEATLQQDGLVFHGGQKVAMLMKGDRVKCSDRIFDEQGNVYNSRGRYLGTVAILETEPKRSEVIPSVATPDSPTAEREKYLQQMKDLDSESLHQFKETADVKIAKLDKEIPRMQEQIGRLESLIKRRNKRSEVLQDASNLMNDDHFSTVCKSYQEACEGFVEFANRHHSEGDNREET
ncbi:unnamed protein product [Alternaria alternata]